MDHSLETDVAAAASAGGFLAWRRRHALPPGTACYNCTEVLQGPWCHRCGQLGEDFHRTAHHLVWEALESFFHADGRLWHTVPRLLFEPAALTRDYLAGKRASQVPPLRLFLIMILLVFVAGEIAAATGQFQFLNIPANPEIAGQIKKSLKIHLYAPWDPFLNAWIRSHVAHAFTHPNAFVAAMAAWAHDFAFLALPISALILSLLFRFRRGVLLFDNLIFCMHSLAFQGLLFIAWLAAGPAFGSVAGYLWLLCPTHLFVHMRGTYDTGRLGTLVRMSVLGTASLVAFGVLSLALVLIGLSTLAE